MIYLRARYMNPRLGVFLARDPWSGDMLRPGSMNGFGYVEGNPINRVDPSGLVSGWPPEVIERLDAVKLFILDSANGHNKPITNMDNQSFAALIAAILRHEKLTAGLYPDNANYEFFHDTLSDLTGSFRGDPSTGLASIRPSIALEILKGEIRGVDGAFCYTVKSGFDYNSLM